MSKLRYTTGDAVVEGFYWIKTLDGIESPAQYLGSGRWSTLQYGGLLTWRGLRLLDYKRSIKRIKP